MNPRTGETTVTVDLEFVCPFCKGKVSVATKPEHAVIHTLPMCERYERLPIDEFLTACRKAMQS